MSRTGELSSASSHLTVKQLLSISTSLTTQKPMGLGRTGARVENTPLLFILPCGTTFNKTRSA
jgi:hypothetical protein